jgi:hypothetical protein
MNLTDRQSHRDLAATLSSVVCTNPHLDIWCRFSAGQRECIVRVSDVAKEFSANERCGLAIARRVSEKIRNGLAERPSLFRIRNRVVECGLPHPNTHRGHGGTRSIEEPHDGLETLARAPQRGGPRHPNAFEAHAAM